LIKTKLEKSEMIKDFIAYVNSNVEREENTLEFENTLTFADKVFLCNILMIINDYVET
jgi:hypothetical protein